MLKRRKKADGTDIESNLPLIVVVVGLVVLVLVSFWYVRTKDQTAAPINTTGKTFDLDTGMPRPEGQDQMGMYNKMPRPAPLVRDPAQDDIGGASSGYYSHPNMNRTPGSMDAVPAMPPRRNDGRP